MRKPLDCLSRFAVSGLGFLMVILVSPIRSDATFIGAKVRGTLNLSGLVGNYFNTAGDFANVPVTSEVVDPGIEFGLDVFELGLTPQRGQVFITVDLLAQEIKLTITNFTNSNFFFPYVSTVRLENIVWQGAPARITGLTLIDDPGQVDTFNILDFELTDNSLYFRFDTGTVLANNFELEHYRFDVEFLTPTPTPKPSPTRTPTRTPSRAATPTPSEIPTLECLRPLDLDPDGRIDCKDLLLVIADKTIQLERSDFNCDMRVGYEDLFKFSTTWWASNPDF